MPTLGERISEVDWREVGRVAKKLSAVAAKRRLLKAVPVVGPVVSVFAGYSNIRNKGVVRGGVDTALDLLPWVGRAKAVYEELGGELIPPRESRA